MAYRTVRRAPARPRRRTSARCSAAARRGAAPPHTESGSRCRCRARARRRRRTRGRLALRARSGRSRRTAGSRRTRTRPGARRLPPLQEGPGPRARPARRLRRALRGPRARPGRRSSPGRRARRCAAAAHSSAGPGELDFVALDERVGEQALAHPLELGPCIVGAGRVDVEIDQAPHAGLVDGESEVAERAADRLSLGIENAGLRPDEDGRLHRSTTLGSPRYSSNAISVSRSKASTYRALVPLTTSWGSSGPGAFLSQPSVSQ